MGGQPQQKGSVRHLSRSWALLLMQKRRPPYRLRHPMKWALLGSDLPLYP